MGIPDTSREPFPDRILDEVGCCFGIGAVGGSAFHLFKGMYNSPKGSRLIGGTQAVRMNAPRIGGRFAVWGGLFTIFDCSMDYVRHKGDPWNSIIAGAVTGGFLSMRLGLGAVSRSSIFGGALLAFVVGIETMLDKDKDISAHQHPPICVEESMPAAGIQLANVGTPSTSSYSPSRLGGLFGGDQKPSGYGA